ncbi:MAG TPA: TonB-dependent receptor [Thermoanaerobaculia bacterium]|nr:TonB-dependent receptor [Thermoanaerobaculia bacterium]
MKTSLFFAALSAAALSAALGQNAPPPPPAPDATAAPAPVAETVVVSATESPEIETEIPGNVTVVTGDELRRRNVHDLATALQDVVGLDTGIGSDNGALVPNVGMWGLKEFDALLFMVDGVPVGGPFNPSLAQINVDDIDRIEIVKGPQGTLYGVSGFAGMVQIFTRGGEKGSHVTLTGGSFSHGRVDGSTNVPLGGGSLRLFGNVDRSNGWQDRTDLRDDRGGFRLDHALAGGQASLVFNAIRSTQLWGSPLPVDPPTGEVIPGFRVDRNYAVDGARLDHRVFSVTTGFDRPLSTAVALVNTLSFAHDDQISVRSFVDPGSVENGAVASSGVSLKPTEEDVYEDLHFLGNFSAAGSHRLVAGAALTWGRTVATGTGFDFTVGLDPIAVPGLGDVPAGDHRSFNDRRTFFGIYANDEWNPLPWLEITAGARHDWVSEDLFAKAQEFDAPEPTASRDARSDAQWSGGISGLFRLIGDRGGSVNEANLYVAAKSSFKPAAPNLTEAESARILEPERTRSGEVGVKTRWLDRQLSLDVSFFHMIFENLVVSILGSDNNPRLVNAGKERFQGMEIQAGFRPGALPDLDLVAGYAHHDAKYVDFTFIDPDEGLLDASGQRLELTPRDLWNVKLAYLPAAGVGAWAAVRHQNHRPFDKINEAYMPSFFEWDAGLSWSFNPHARVSVVGRNLGNDRHYVAESEIGDAQLYVAPPRRFTGELSVSF